MMFFCIGVQVLSIVGIGIVLHRRNVVKRGGGRGEGVSGLGWSDVTDLRNPGFRVSISCLWGYWRGRIADSFGSMCIRWDLGGGIMGRGFERRGGSYLTESISGVGLLPYCRVGCCLLKVDI